MANQLAQVTIVVVPRDRFSSVVNCAKSIVENTAEPFRLVFLDFGYSKTDLARIHALAGDLPLEIVDCGRSIPLAAFRNFLPRIETPYVAWVDNDTYVTPGWLTALLARAAPNANPRASVILPLTLERDGMDVDPRKLPLRNHISHSELRSIEIEGKTFIFDHKPFRRAAPEDLPQEPHRIDFFELHTFFAETDLLRKLQLPDMVVREHIDIGMQLRGLGVDIWCEPNSRVHFENIHERPTLSDLKFFFYRWNERLIDQSHELFAERWGYHFLNEQFLKNWAFRRKVFSLCRFAGLPARPSDLVARVLNKFCRPRIPQKFLGDPLPQSRRVLCVDDSGAAGSSGRPQGPPSP